MKILIVDDDDIALDVLAHALTQAGHEPVVAHRGSEALEVLRQGTCRLVVSDWVMPEMDGLELCRQIRAEPFDAYVYVILLTSRDSRQDLVEGMSAGADDFVTKPFDPMELRARIQAGERILSLETRTSAAEAASRAKTEFLANMSHEIRTPMTAILGFAETLDDATLSDSERREAIGTIRRNGERLLSIMDDILELAEMEAGRIECTRVPYQPTELMAEVASVMRPRAKEAGLELSVEYAGSPPPLLYGDPARTRHILVSLIDNAIKFTERGSVRVIAQLVHPDDTGPLLLFDIVDTGIGMTEDQVARIFQPFAQADTSLTRRHGGAGLGLTICSRLAKMLGGGVEVVETRPGVGTRIRATVSAGLNDVPPAGCPVSTAGAMETVLPAFGRT